MDQQDEALTLERLKRAIAHAKGSKDGFMSFKDKCRLVIGANAALRAVENGSASLLVIPAKLPEPARDVFSDLACAKSCSIWTPNLSSQALGRIVGLRAPCMVLAFTKQGDAMDALGSIRDHVLGKLTHGGKRLKMDQDKHDVLT